MSFMMKVCKSHVKPQTPHRRRSPELIYLDKAMRHKREADHPRYVRRCPLNAVFDGCRYTRLDYIRFLSNWVVTTP